jgi:methionyl-tRNA synthetase
VAKFYITTAIDYVNAAPHLGHAYEKIAADAIARYRRLRGDDVFFLTGVDEHGSKIEKAAAAAGLPPKAFVDRITPRFISTWKNLGIRHDGFIRTTDERHVAAVREAFARLIRRGDVEKAPYEGLYCAGCEEFKTERDLIDGTCPQHGTAPQTHREENYVFRLSRYKDRIRAHIEANPGFIAPETRRNEILNLLDSFPDVSVSRRNIRWGVPVPGDEEQVVYVWIDALLNYLTGIGWGRDDATFRRFWPADLHVVGKDITKFHAIIWPALLMALDLPLPRCIHGHGWVTAGETEKKMSKSLGNVVEPDAIAERFGADALRHFLLREIVFGKDGSFTLEALRDRANADLANDLGNALQRTLGLLARHRDGRVTADAPDVTRGLAARVDETRARVEARMDDLEIHAALEAIWGLVDAVNKFIDAEAPWTLAKKGNVARLDGVLYGALEALRNVAILAAPFVPTIAGRIRDQLGLAGSVDEARWADIRWGGLTEGTATRPAGPVYPRIIDDVPPPASAPSASSAEISIDDFGRLDLRIAEVIAAERVPKADRLLALDLDLGAGGRRRVVAGIAARYAPEALVGRRVVVVANLESAKIRGVESRGMILCADADGGPVIVSPEAATPPGTKVK